MTEGFMFVYKYILANMRSVHIPDVGHGLAAEITTTSGDHVQIDCGSLAYKKYKPRLIRNLRRWNCFFLSHYHEDHYMGLKYVSDDSARIEKVRFPKIPDFKNRQEFIKALVAINLLPRPHQTGAWRTDLYQTICRINTINFSFEAVSQGDSINVGSSKFEVLWPPENLPDDEDAFSESIKKFNKAVQEDELLKIITEKIEEREMIKPYLSGEEIDPHNFEKEDILSDLESAIEEREVPEVTKEARECINDAADMMSVVMYMDNRLLFMGDIPEKYIEQIVEKLVEKTRTHFQVMITPHHGTRWDDAMEDLNTNWAISSIGDRFSGNLEPRYKSISKHHRVTLYDGGVRLNSHMIEEPYRYIHEVL